MAGAKDVGRTVERYGFASNNRWGIRGDYRFQVRSIERRRARILRSRHKVRTSALRRCDHQRPSVIAKGRLFEVPQSAATDHVVALIFDEHPTFPTSADRYRFHLISRK